VVLIRESLSRLFKRPRRRKIMKSLSLKQAASLLLLTFIIATARSGHAQDYKVLYRFPGPPNGKLPNAHLIGGKVKGNLSLIGTTQEGGKYCANSPTCGIVFSFSGMAGEIVIYRFTGQFDGYAASGGLAIDSQANAYGLAGGGGTGCGGFGCGTVFKIDNPSGAFSELYSFAGPPNDGESPAGSLLWDPVRGNFYGVTGFGGNNGIGEGTIFSITPSGIENVLYNFCSLPNCADGQRPVEGLVEDAQGNLYGVTLYGGSGNTACDGMTCGAVFKLDGTGHETVLHSFTNGVDGGLPQAGLVSDGQGSFYGATSQGGNGSTACTGGCGTVFKIDASGNFSVIHSFSGPDGGYPRFGSMAWSAKTGLLYGATSDGGEGDGSGVIFEMDTSGNETVLHNFGGSVEGSVANLGVILDSSGNIYGTTLSGGYGERGVIFRLIP
jgi:uncharacterized repeat protein (TIGR03803 family)